MEKCQDCMGRWISVLNRQFQVYMNRELKPYGMNSSEFMYIPVLFSKEEGMSQEELSKELFLDKAAVARTVKSLENKGFVLRLQDKENYKKKRVYLTDKAKEFSETLRDILNKWDDRVKDMIGEEKYNIISLGLNSIAVEEIKLRNEEGTK